MVRTALHNFNLVASYTNSSVRRASSQLLMICSPHDWIVAMHSMWGCPGVTDGSKCSSTNNNRHFLIYPRVIATIQVPWIVGQLPSEIQWAGFNMSCLYERLLVSVHRLCVSSRSPLLNFIILGLNKQAFSAMPPVL